MQINKDEAWKELLKGNKVISNQDEITFTGKDNNGILWLFEAEYRTPNAFIRTNTKQEVDNLWKKVADQGFQIF